MRLRRRTSLRLFAVLMLAITFNNVLAIEHMLPAAYGADGHSEAATTEPRVAFVMPDATESGETHGRHSHKHKAKPPEPDAQATQQSKAAPTNLAQDEDEPHDSHSHEHVQHCHISPGTCSDQPVPSGPGQMLFAEPLLPALNLQYSLIDESNVVPTLLALDTLTPPPRA